MATLFIIRGLPGSGKSTLARMLVRSTVSSAHLETDMFFTGADGTYLFDRNKLSEAHNWCLAEVVKSMDMGLENIFVSNTFTRRWEYQPYIDRAKERGYNVQIVECTSSHGSVHGVPQETMIAMRSRWENHNE